MQGSDHPVKRKAIKGKGNERLWHVRTGAPQECHVRIEYFEVVIHEMPCNINKRIQNMEFRIQNCCRAFGLRPVPGHPISGLLSSIMNNDLIEPHSPVHSSMIGIDYLLVLSSNGGAPDGQVGIV